MRIRYSLLLILLVSFPALAGKLYSWVDEHGKTHYGNTVPPQYAQQGNTELNKRGAVVKKTDAALTPGQRKAKEAELAQQKEDEKKVLEQKRRDKALLNTYTTEKEIDLVRDRNLQQGELQLQSMELRTKQIQPQLDRARKRKEDLVAKKRPLPPDLQQELEEKGKELRRLQEMIQLKRAEMDAIRARFEDDKKRFRELSQVAGSAR
jgi:chromosome segregation ATPase